MKKGHRVLWLLLGLPALTGLFFSCNNENRDVSAQKVFRYNQASGISSLDPAFAKDQAGIWAVSQLFEGLVQLDENLKPAPAIANRWEISPDGLSYSFFLRKDIFFHSDPAFPDGKSRRVVARDVVYSFSRITDPATASPGAWIFNNRIDQTQPFSAPNDSTFVLRLSRPFAPMINILTMPYCFIVPEEAVAHYGKDFRKNPVGTGPFRFKTWKEGSLLILVKNESYHESIAGKRLPFLDGVRISFIESKQTEYLKFIQGELDFLSGLAPGFVDELLDKSGNLKPIWADKIILEKMPFLNTEYLGFNFSSPEISSGPYSDVRVRQALNLGFDRAEMLTYLRNGIGRPADGGIVPPSLPPFSGQPVQGFNYDPEKAAALLAEAGFPLGKGLPPIRLFTNETYADLCTFIARQLANLGIEVKIEVAPASIQREMMARGELAFFRGSWIADYPDPESFLAMFFGQHTAPPNYTRYNDSHFNRLYENAMAASDPAERERLYRQMDSLLIAANVVVPVYYDEVVRFRRKNIVNLGLNAMNMLSLKAVDIE